MPPLKNNRHERFALAILKGMSQKDAAIEAGYKNATPAIDVTACRLLRIDKIIERIRELQQQSEAGAVMSVGERKEKLSQIGRGLLTDYVDGKGKISLETNPGALAEVVVEDWRGGKEGRAYSQHKKVKLHPPIQAIQELNKMGGDYPPSKVEVEPGEKMTEALAGLLSRLRGYEKKG